MRGCEFGQSEAVEDEGPQCPGFNGGIDVVNGCRASLLGMT